MAALSTAALAEAPHEEAAAIAAEAGIAAEAIAADGVEHLRIFRLKHDLGLLGRLDDGLGYYRFVYNGGHTAYVGVIAQEVRSFMPAAVTHRRSGQLHARFL